MAIAVGYAGDRRVELSAGEVTGAVGDSVTVLPVVVAVAALTPLQLPTLLVWFAAFQVVWGLWYGLPLSVEPMKALAALVLSGALAAGELAAAGLLAGGVLAGVGATGALGRVERYLGRPVVRGVQLAVALVLLETGLRLSLGGPALAAVAAGVALVVAGLGYRRAAAIAVLAVGGAVALATAGAPAPALPSVGVALPSADALRSAATLRGTAAQLAMTVGNAAVATSLLLSDYFDAEVPADDLAASMGVTNLVAVPLGGMPMCHGSAGVAGKYAHGARTAGANLVLGALYALAAVFGAGLVAAFPMAVLGVVLAVVAAELGRAALRTDRLALTVAVGLLGLATNVGLAFVAGAAAHLAWERFESSVRERFESSARERPSARE